MKITRKKSGVTVRCTDSEFEALQELVEIGGLSARLAGNAKSAHTRRTKNGAFLRIDVDKR